MTWVPNTTLRFYGGALHRPPKECIVWRPAVPRGEVGAAGLPLSPLARTYGPRDVCETPWDASSDLSMRYAVDDRPVDRRTPLAGSDPGWGSRLGLDTPRERRTPPGDSIASPGLVPSVLETTSDAVSVIKNWVASKDESVPQTLWRDPISSAPPEEVSVEPAGSMHSATEGWSPPSMGQGPRREIELRLAWWVFRRTVDRPQPYGSDGPTANRQVAAWAMPQSVSWPNDVDPVHGVRTPECDAMRWGELAIGRDPKTKAHASTNAVSSGLSHGPAPVHWTQFNGTTSPRDAAPISRGARQFVGEIHAFVDKKWPPCLQRGLGIRLGRPKRTEREAFEWRVAGPREQDWEFEPGHLRWKRQSNGQTSTPLSPRSERLFGAPSWPRILGQGEHLELSGTGLRSRTRPGDELSGRQGIGTRVGEYTSNAASPPNGRGTPTPRGWSVDFERRFFTALGQLERRAEPFFWETGLPRKVPFPVLHDPKTTDWFWDASSKPSGVSMGRRRHLEDLMAEVCRTGRSASTSPKFKERRQWAFM